MKTACAAAWLMAQPHLVQAEDIDLYTGGLVDAGRPNIIFILDNSANWSASNGAANCTYDDTGGAPSSQDKKMGIEQCALNNALHALKPAIIDGVEQPAKFNIGFMLFNEGSVSGGYPRKALLELNRANAEALMAMIKSFHINNDKTNGASFAQTMHEAFLYFSGLAPYRGKSGDEYDESAFSGGTYVRATSNPCQKNYLIIIANGSPDSNSAGTDAALLRQDGGNATPIVYPTSYVGRSDQASMADEFARFLYGTDLSTDSKQNVVTHTIAVTGASSDGNFPNFWAGVANAGGGKAYTANQASSLKAAILNLLNEIQSVNSVFTSSSLPVSINTQGTYLNQIFMGMFRPDVGAAPRWMGNLKQYQFCLDKLQKLYLGDADCVNAVSSSTGFITPLATSFWSSPSSYWNFGTYLAESASDAPDGNIVEKGGAAQLQRGIAPAARKLYTCPASGCVPSAQLANSPFNSTTLQTNDTANQAKFGVASSTALGNLINWIRGQDLFDENRNNSTADMRASVHGDVLHSRPVVVNYGGTRGIVAFYGANDGVFRAVNASQSGTDAGKELWGFVAPEFYGKYKRLYDNSPIVKFPSTVPGTSPEPLPKDYFFDGPIGLYQQLDASGATSRVILYIGMRRGGRFIYALDVTAPENPVFLWKRGCYPGANGTTTCDNNAAAGDFSLMGQSWSTPKPARVKGHANPVLIFGAGYDNATEDAEPAGGTTTMGNAVFVVDAITGNMVRKFSGPEMNRSIPADITLMDRDLDGHYDRAYATDMGGNVWRMDIDDAAPANWAINKLASLSTAAQPRKLFYAADVVPTKNYDAVLIGSGDREHPLRNSLASNVLNRFYMIKDVNTGKTVPSPYTTIADSDADSSSDFFNATSTAYDGSKKGWFINLAAGEKVVNAPTTIAGFVHFGTNKPAPTLAGQCTNLGVAQGYTVDFVNGNPSRPVNFVGGGFPPSPVAGLVSITTNGQSKFVPFIIGGGDDGSGTLATGSAIAGSEVKIAVPTSRRRTYWHKK